MGLLSCNLGGRGQLNIIFKLFMSIIKIKSLEDIRDIHSQIQKDPHNHYTLCL